MTWTHQRMEAAYFLSPLTCDQKGCRGRSPCNGDGHGPRIAPQSHLPVVSALAVPVGTMGPRVAGQRLEQDVAFLAVRLVGELALPCRPSGVPIKDSREEPLAPDGAQGGCPDEDLARSARRGPNDHFGYRFRREQRWDWLRLVGHLVSLS